MKVSFYFSEVSNAGTKGNLSMEKEEPFYSINKSCLLWKEKEKKKKKVENNKSKWCILQCYDAQGQFWFDALAIYMEFYSSGFSKIQQK